MIKKERDAIYYNLNKDKCKENMRIRNRNIKMKILTAYSKNGIIKCNLCEENDPTILNLDHINGGGRIHAKECRAKGTNIYDDLIKQNFPPGFQILCPNCNYIKRCENQEHRKCNGKETNAHRKYHQKLRLELIDAYSMCLRKCKICGCEDIRVLCLDHINSDGGIHRKIKGGSYGTWRDLKKNNYPETMQVLCQTCNRRKMHNNQEFGKRNNFGN